MKCSKLVCLAVVAAVLGIGCSKKKKDEEKTAEQLRAEALALPVKPADALSGVATSLGNVAAVQSTGGKSMNPAALSTGLAGVDDYCKSSGTPKDGIYTTSTGQYAALFAYCNYAKRPDGPDTVLGAIDRVRGWLCAMGDLTYDGTERTLNFQITTSCFSETFVNMVQDELGTTTFDATVTANNSVAATFGSTEYENSIAFSIASLGLTYHILYKQEGAVLSASIKSGSGEGGEDGDYFAISLDRGATSTDDGSIRVDGRFSEASGSNPMSRHVRAYATGAYDTATSTMTTLTHMEFAQMDYYASSTNGRLISAKGNPNDGIYAVSVSSSTDPQTSISGYTPSTDGTYCYGDGTCTGNTGIQLSTTDDLKFMTGVVYGNSNYTSSEDMFLATGPLAYTSIDLSK